MTADLTGRTVVLTGGTGGLGRHLLAHLTGRGATTVLVARDRRRAEAAVSVLGAAAASVEIEEGDLASQASVRALAQRLAGRPVGVHALINNAGAIFAARETDREGIERSVAVNHLGPLLLTTLLLPRLRSAAPAAIVNLSSGSVHFGDLEDLHSERKYGPNRAYGTAKLANLAASLELSRQLERESPGQVRVLSVDPGAMRTGMGEDLPGPLGVFNRRLKPNQQPIERTAATVIRAATDPTVGTGKWLDLKGRPKKLPRVLRQPEAQARQLRLANDLLNLTTLR